MCLSLGHLAIKIRVFAAPDKIHWAPGIPNTRSGKIMRTILRKIASGHFDELGDTSTLADPSVVDQQPAFLVAVMAREDSSDQASVAESKQQSMLLLEVLPLIDRYLSGIYI